MLSFNQIKNNEYSNDYILSEIETIVRDFLSPEISLEAIERAKSLDNENLKNALELYFNEYSKNLFISCLNLNNLYVFLDIESQEIKKEVKEWIIHQDSLKTIKGKLNPETLSFKPNDPIYSNILTKLDFQYNLNEIIPFKESLVLIEENPNQYFDSVLEMNDSILTLQFGQISQKETKRQEFWKNSLISGVSASLIIGSLFINSAQAEEGDVDRAIKHGTKALMRTDSVKEIVKEKTDKAEETVKEFAEETGLTVPVVVVGYGIKSIVDKKVQVQGKGLKALGVSMRYNMAVGFDSKVYMGVSGDNPYMKNSNFKIEGTHQPGEQKLEMKLNIDF